MKLGRSELSYFFTLWLHLMKKDSLVRLTYCIIYTHSSIHPFTHSSIHPFSHSPILPFSHSPILPFSHSPIHPFTHTLHISIANYLHGFHHHLKQKNIFIRLSRRMCWQIDLLEWKEPAQICTDAQVQQCISTFASA